jgi:hypothetical protein
MSAVKTILATKHAFLAEGLAWTLPAEGGSVTTSEETTAKKETSAGTHLKNVALFFAAPFVGLAYVMALPLVGLGMIAWIAGKKLLASKTARSIALAIAAPFATIAFVTVAPVVGLGALAWVGGRALLKS